MKSLKKILVSFAIAVPMLFIPSGIGRADLWGIQDMALLIQQIAQYAQDEALSYDQIADLKRKYEKAKQIGTTVKNLGKAGTAAQSIIDLADCGINMTRAYSEVDGYVNYIKRFGPNFRLTDLSWIVSSFRSRTTNTINSCLKAFSSLVSMFDDQAEPMDLMSLMKQMKDDAEKKNNEDAEEVTSQTAEMCVNVSVDNAKKVETELNATVIAPK